MAGACVCSADSKIRMAANHVAIMRSASRTAHQKAMESHREGDEESQEMVRSVEKSLSELSVISDSNSSEDDDLNHEMSIRKSKNRQETSNTMSKSMMHKCLINSLEPIESALDITTHVQPGLNQLNVLDRLEKRWFEISANVEDVLRHLKKCSYEVTTASKECLESFKSSIDLTCDKIDQEIKALYDLMTLCDELTTKLSIAGSFRDEIKTLKKSVETLENLYKLRPQMTARSQ